jgi:hypothetical protein
VIEGALLGALRPFRKPKQAEWASRKGPANTIASRLWFTTHTHRNQEQGVHGESRRTNGSREGPHPHIPKSEIRGVERTGGPLSLLSRKPEAMRRRKRILVPPIPAVPCSVEGCEKLELPPTCYMQVNGILPAAAAT